MKNLNITNKENSQNKINLNNQNDILENIITKKEIKNFNLQNYLKQASNDEAKYWINHNLKNYLLKPDNQEDVTEIEHIIDYLNSDCAPKRLQKMSYKQAKDSSDKWLKSQIKKGKTIKEEDKDIETFMEFDNGFKIVKLLGENAYKKEGFLMAHCVASYYEDKNCSIYSLRDRQNNPHATVELKYQDSSINQVKGKGNGSIHPSYINYLLEFFEKLELPIRDSELRNLGYKSICQKTFEMVKNIEGLKFLQREKDQYLFIHSKALLTN